MILIAGLMNEARGKGDISYELNDWMNNEVKKWIVSEQEKTSWMSEFQPRMVYAG